MINGNIIQKLNTKQVLFPQLLFLCNHKNQALHEPALHIAFSWIIVIYLCIHESDPHENA